MFFNTSIVQPIILSISLFAGRALACSCSVPPPPCQAVGQTPLVFLGTVTRISTQPGAFKTAQMHVDRLYKGQVKETIELFDDGMCDGPLLEIGRQYLMYTSQLSTGAIPARGCSRSRSVQQADEDLEFLKQYSAGEVATHISGTVRFRPDEDRELGYQAPSPLKDVRVTVSRDGKEFSTKTNSLGEYSFTGLSPGQYEIDAAFSGYRLNWGPFNLSLRANGCVESDLLMQIDRRVFGAVRNASGEPVPGIMVEMLSVNRQLKSWEQPVLLDVTDEQGRYVIAGIPPGDYYLGINIKSTPTKERPYPSTFYPNTADASQALRIGFGIGASVQQRDLTAPSKLALVTMQGRIVNSDGTPPRADDHPQVRIKEPGLFGQIEEESINIDAEGRFQFDLCEGIRYSAYAFAGPMRTQTYSPPVEFVPAQENSRLVLTLGLTSEEFQKARRAFEGAAPPR